MEGYDILHNKQLRCHNTHIIIIHILYALLTLQRGGI